MLRRIEDPTSVTSDVVLPAAHALIHALTGCCHPRAARLRSRLCDCQNESELSVLRAEVRNLLALSFGPPEANRRLQLQ